VNAAFLLVTTAWLAGADPAPAAPAVAPAVVPAPGHGACDGGSCGACGGGCCDTGCCDTCCDSCCDTCCNTCCKEHFLKRLFSHCHHKCDTCCDTCDTCGCGGDYHGAYYGDHGTAHGGVVPGAPVSPGTMPKVEEKKGEPIPPPKDGDKKDGDKKDGDKKDGDKKDGDKKEGGAGKVGSVPGGFDLTPVAPAVPATGPKTGDTDTKSPF